MLSVLLLEERTVKVKCLEKKDSGIADIGSEMQGVLLVPP